jgi:VWFA-related protein
MIKKIFYLWILISFLWGGYMVGQQEDEAIKETVRVVNVEVPVRVYEHGKPVDNLTKNDFKLYEGGKRQDINGFILKKKRIKVQDLEMTAEQEKTLAPRYFALTFRITHYNDYLKEGLDYIFDKILRASDQLLVFANDRTAFFKNLADKNSIKTELDRMLFDASLEARNKLLLFLKQIETLVNKVNLELILQDQSAHRDAAYYDVMEYLDKVLEVWHIYKLRYLIPDINKYYNFARLLKNIDKEKWVINFYQFEVFPNILVNGESMRRINNMAANFQASADGKMSTFGRMIEKKMMTLDKEMSLAKDFPSEEVAKIFHNVDTTFHSIFMKTSITTLMQDIEYREIATELESSLRAITDRTGGKLLVSNKLDNALDQISEVEDVYYVLTYAPKNPDKVGKIKVKLNNHKYKLVYSPNLRTGYLAQFLEEKQIEGKNPDIRDLKFNQGKLVFGVTDFTWKEKEGGILSIHIRIEDQQGKTVFDEEKTVKATQKKINIALNIKGIEKGEYDVVIDVVDLFTKMSGTEILKTKISN